MEKVSSPSSSRRSAYLEALTQEIKKKLTRVKAFLNQRSIELRNEDTLSLQHHVQAFFPLVLQQYSPETIDSDSTKSYSKKIRWLAFRL